MPLYAQNTAVPVERSKGEIERTLRRYGASEFIFGSKASMAVLGFKMRDRFVRFDIPLPLFADFLKSPHGRRRSNGAAVPVYDRAVRQKWRALALVIKAKLEAVESGVTVFEKEFLAHFILPDGRTVGDHVLPHVADAYKTGKVPPLLPGPGAK
jgi:hypothetical protein